MSVTLGTTFAGDYQIVEQIGQNSLGTVYKAHQPALARYVALKVLPAAAASREGFTERFLQQAAELARLRHYALVQVYAYGVEQDTAYLVTELIEHRTLDSLIGNPLPYDGMERILTPVASVMDYAHEAGILHRNVKPSNILLSRDGRVFLGDLGIASLLEGSRERAARQTTFGLPLGTPAYMSPEGAAGEPIGPPADRYALAVVAFEMLTGQVPFIGNTPMAVVLDQLRKPPPPPSSLNPEVTPAVDAVILRGLAKDPAQRYATASAFVTDLFAAGAGAPLASVAVPATPEPLPPLTSPDPMPAGVAATVGARTGTPRQVRPASRGGETGTGQRLSWALAKGAGETRSHVLKPVRQLSAEGRARLAWIAYRLGRKTGVPGPALLALAALLVLAILVALVRR